MKYVQGEVLTNEGFTTGYLCIEQTQKVSDIRKGNAPEKPIVNGLIIPTCVNAHTHLGDSFIRYKHLQLPHNVKDLVAPPAGLKHRLLKQTSEQEILEGIKKSLAEMTTAGTTCFCDFREGGLIGVYQLKKAMQHRSIDSVILSRPSQLTYEKQELDRLLENSDGIGLSSISDWEPSEIEKLASHVRRKKKLFALHASEVNRENIDRSYSFALVFAPSRSAEADSVGFTIAPSFACCTPSTMMCSSVACCPPNVLALMSSVLSRSMLTAWVKL
mgnify:CR=1 FL=1